MKKTYMVITTGLLSSALAGSFVCCPVFAEGKADISIVELMDDGSGELRPWEDIVNAMPGETYSAIPRVRNDGTESVKIKMCLSESSVSSTGEPIALPPNTFGITINEHWNAENDGDTSDPASGNCYNYESKVNPGDITEPLFSEVSLNGELGNDFQGNTFSLHLDAYAETEDESQEEPSEGSEDDGSEGSATDGGSPSNPDTGTMTNNEKMSSVVSFIPYFLGSAALIVLMIHLVRSFIKAKK